jgi:hypothetical protein
MAMSDEVGVAPRPIDVEADAQITTHMVTKSHTERSNVVGPVGDGNCGAGAIAIRQVLRASPRYDVEWTINLLCDRAADAGLKSRTCPLDGLGRNQSKSTASNRA